MTGDETKHTDQDKSKCLCANCIGSPNYQNQEIGSKSVDDPVASNTGKELKPCPFCGELPVYDALVYCQKDDCPAYLRDSSFEDWNNAWAHKRIADLEIEIQEDYFNSGETIARYVRQLDAADIKIASLESSLEGMKKRNQEDRDYIVRWNNLADRIQAVLKKEKRCLSCDDQIEEADCSCFDQRDAYVVGRWFDEILERLKTAEGVIAKLNDSLAAAKRKNDRMQINLDGIIASRKERP